MEICLFFILRYGAVVVLVEILVDLCDVVVDERLVCLLIDNIDVFPFRTNLAAVRDILWTIRCGNPNIWHQ